MQRKNRQVRRERVKATKSMTDKMIGKYIRIWEEYGDDIHFLPIGVVKDYDGQMVLICHNCSKEYTVILYHQVDKPKDIVDPTTLEGVEWELEEVQRKQMVEAEKIAKTDTKGCDCCSEKTGTQDKEDGSWRNFDDVKKHREAQMLQQTEERNNIMTRAQEKVKKAERAEKSDTEQKSLDGGDVDMGVAIVAAEARATEVNLAEEAGRPDEARIARVAWQANEWKEHCRRIVLEKQERLKAAAERHKVVMERERAEKRAALEIVEEHRRLKRKEEKERKTAEKAQKTAEMAQKTAAMSAELDEQEHE